MSSQSSHSPQTPAVRTFQMDGSTQGSLASSVNLFRGDVNLSQPLFTLPGRSGEGLDVSIAIQYQSNVFREATTWNADAPTGVLGLGWSLPLTWIEAEAGSSPVAATRQYVFYDNGSANRLFRQPLVPALFSLAASFASGLYDGATLPAALRDQFRARGIAVSTGSVIRGSGPWTVHDGVLMQTFVLTREGDFLVVRDGGELYQLQSYQFWKVLYYPTYERWVVISESGMRRSFGGRGPDYQGFATSLGNSIAWSVYWGDGAGKPAWTGPGDQVAGQVQVARAWYLYEIRDRFGSAVTYKYNGGARTASGILPVAEQQVGAGGKPYTKAVYLHSITDSFGRTIRFKYAAKLWSDAVREYADPHRDVPSELPGAYQDRYETQYLASVEVDSATGNRMYSFEFEYAPRPAANGPERAVANFTTHTGALRRDTFKRLLTSVTQRDRDGVASPPVRFTYDLGPGTPGGQPGALLGVTQPQGGTARYTYERHELPLCDRALVVDRPAGVPDGANPRVFHGPDYIVVCYYNQSWQQLSLQVFTWTGRWVGWAPRASGLLDSGGLSLDTLMVHAQADFLAVSFNRTGGDLCVYVFQRDTAKPSQWRAGTVDGVTADLNRPNFVYAARGTPVQIRGGHTFLVVGQMNPDQLTGSHDVLTWRWTTQSWTRTTTQLSRYGWIAAGAEWFAVLDRDGNLALSYLDGTQAWRSAAPAKIAGLSVGKLDDVQLAAGAGMLVVANQTASSSQLRTYQLHLVQWSADYALTLGAYGPFTDRFGTNNPPLPWTPTIVKDTLVAVNGNLLRRAGGTWIADTSLSAAPPSNSGVRFAYASDCAVRVCVPKSGVGSSTAELAAYDPAGAPQWTRTVLAVGLPPNERGSRPSAGDGDWLVVGPHAWFRGAATSWAQRVVAAPTLDLGAVVRDATGDPGAVFHADSLVDQAPGFWAFTVTQGAQQSAHAIVLRNGGVEQYSEFPAEELYTAARGGAGPKVFVSFPAHYSDLNTAQTIMLHRYAGQAVQGAITHYTVVRVEMEDGFDDTISTAYAPELTTAAADASGDVVKFYQNTVYPGSSAAPHAPYGSVVSRYLNGAAEKTGDEFDDVLDGLLVATETRAADGALLESTSSTWSVFRQVASSPTDPKAPAVQLRGAWVTQGVEQRMKDGITAVKRTSYVPVDFSAPVTGQPVSEAVSNVGGSGAAELIARFIRHGVQYYPSLWAIHALAEVAQVDVFVNTNQTSILQSSSVTTFGGWASHAGEGVLSPASIAGFTLKSAATSTFPFLTWSPGQTPEGWVLTTLTTGRSRHGQETACVDASGVAATTITDLNAMMPVASIANAAPGECAYLGFQEYEDTTGWTLTNIGFDKSDAWAGTRSAVLTGGGSAIAVTVRPQRADTWFVGCRFRTMFGFVPDGSALEVRVDLGNGQSQLFSLAWSATNGAWTYVTVPVPVSAVGAGGVGTISVTARNTNASSIWVDSILVAPLVTTATMRTFDPDSQQILSSVDASGRLTRTFYDRAFQPVVSVGPNGLVREITGSFLSRSGAPADRFDANSPNVELTLHAAAGGVLESFRDARLWTTRWKPGNSKIWSLGNGALVHSAASLDPITWVTRPAGTYAIYVEPQTSDPAAVISLTAGDVRVQWSGAAGWSAQQGGASWARLTSRATGATHWLLVVGDGVVCFFADGQLLYSQRARPVGNTVTLAVAGVVRLRNLTGVEDIRLGLSYNDAGGRQRQVHQLRGDDSLVCAIVFDDLDRRIATTRSAPGSFGSGASRPPLAYRPGFLDVRAFLQATASTWKMTGDITDYYRGQVEGGIARSNDEGYPYHGIRFEASPRSVQVEVGEPGRGSAIDLTVPPHSRRTVQVEYGVNGSPLGAMKAGEYRETIVTSPVKTVATRVVDRLDQQVGTSFTDPYGTLMARTVGARSYAATAAGPTASLVQRLPNAQVPGPQRDPDAFVRTIVADALQQPTSVTDVDAGQTRFLYDSAGNLRFVQPAMGAGEQWYVYYRYDAIGRQVAEGIVKGAWDPVALQKKVDDRLWPPSSASGVTVSLATEHDGPGNDPTLIGRRWRTTARNPAPSLVPDTGNVVVKEEFSYAVGGEITRVVQTVSGAVSASGVLAYAYNALGELVRIDLPAGCPFASIFYRYDDHGDIVAIGRAPGSDDLGAFGYSADRQPQSWSVTDWTRALEYTSQGWVKSLVTRATAGGQSFAVNLDYEADGALSSRSVSYAFTGLSLGYHDAFAYDGHRRLASATGSSDSRFTSYDANGNLWACTRKGRPSTFTCGEGTDRVQSAAIDGAAESPLAWNARGHLVSGLGRNLEILPASGRTRAIVTSTARLALAYGGAQQRVVKQDLATGRVNVYFRGAGQAPVATLINGTWGVTVYGPLGPVAWISDRTYYLLADATGSVWGAVTGGALSFATAWTPFGSVGASFGDARVVPYGYQGHEWDHEVGLFDFGARLYDPALCRMLAPDPQSQYPSPYVFAGNNPLTTVDPTGELSLAAKIGIGAAMAGLAVAGVALTVATAGAAAPAMTAAAGAALANSMTAAQATSMVAAGGMTAATMAAGTAGSVPTVAAVAAASAAGGAVASVGASQVMAGVSTTGAMSITPAAAAGSVAGSTLISAGIAGVDYTVKYGQSFKADDFFTAVGIGAAAGFAGGVVSAGLAPLAQGPTVGMLGWRAVLGDLGIGAAIGATSGTVSGSVGSILTNVAASKPWYRNLVQNALKGAAASACVVGGGGAGEHVPREPIARRAKQVATVAAQRARTLPQLAKAVAKNDAAYWTVVLGADFGMFGFLVGGVAKGKI